jgi:hypothetical protein
VKALPLVGCGLVLIEAAVVSVILLVVWLLFS